MANTQAFYLLYPMRPINPKMRISIPSVICSSAVFFAYKFNILNLSDLRVNECEWREHYSNAQDHKEEAIESNEYFKEL